jgi:hypothetical protein
VLGYDPEECAYVRFEFSLPSGEVTTVIDVTQAAIKEGRNVSIDWTEVVLFGNEETQDTVAKPFVNISTEKAYIATSLYRRFYRIPDGVKVRLDAPFHRLDGTRAFTPIAQRLDKFARYETVDAQGIKLHFLHDPSIGDKSGNRMSSSAALGSSTTTCALIFKDEMYSVMTGQEWSAAAPRFGVPFGSKEICIHIELPDDAARPTQYRERLIQRESGEDLIPLSYSAAVREYMPDWVRDVIRNASPNRSEDYNDLQKELQDLLNKYRVKGTGRKVDPNLGAESEPDQKGQDLGTGDGIGASSGSGSGGIKNTRKRFHQAPEGATTTSLHEIFERPPNIVMLTTPDEVLERGLKGRAAEFIAETGDLFVNGLYEAVDRTVQDVEPDFAGQGDSEDVLKAVVDAARCAATIKVAGSPTIILAG